MLSAPVCVEQKVQKEKEHTDKENQVHHKETEKEQNVLHSSSCL